MPISGIELKNVPSSFCLQGFAIGSKLKIKIMVANLFVTEAEFSSLKSLGPGEVSVSGNTYSN
jgi:hypothetical protein